MPTGHGLLSSEIESEDRDDVICLLPKIKINDGNSVWLHDSSIKIPNAYREFEEQNAWDFSRQWSEVHVNCEGHCRKISALRPNSYAHFTTAPTKLHQAEYFRYSSLPSETATIRLLKIKGARHGGFIDCEMVHVPLDAHTEYAALSYVWGEQPPDKLIFCNGKLLLIRNNLHKALLRYRSSNKPESRLPLWVDAICINQDDFDERRAQILLMQRIYSQAHRVHIDLGSVGLDWFPGYVLLMRLALVWDKFCSNHTLSDPPSIEEFMTRYGLPSFEYEAWLKLFSIFCSPWFLRTWVIQEISLARRAIVMFGPYSFDWEYLAKSQELCERYSLSNRREDVGGMNFYQGTRAASHMIRVRSGCQLPRDICFAYFAAQVVRSKLPVGKTAGVKFCRPDNALGYNIRLCIYPKLGNPAAGMDMAIPTDNAALAREFDKYHKRLDGLPPFAEDHERWNLEENGFRAFERVDVGNDPLGVMANSRVFKVTEPRDKIFGLLGILSGLGHSFKPDYTMSASEVYRYFAAHYINGLADKKFRDLDVLSLAGLQRRAQVRNIPSWVPDWTSRTICPREFCALRGRHFQAATSAQASIMPADDVSDSLKISVKGLLADTIQSITPPFPTSDEQPSGLHAASQFAEWHKAADEIYHRACDSSSIAYTDPFDAYCRTLIADPKVQDWNQSGYVSLDETAITDPKSFHDLAWTQLETEGLVPQRTRTLGAAGAYISAMAVAAGGRCFAVTAGGRMALVPWCAQEGDRICVLLGSKTPHVLREDQTKESYVLVGDAYVHGIMYGEALGLGLAEEKIVIV